MNDPVPQATVPASAVEDLRAVMRGPVVVPGDPAYHDLRAVYNAAVDQYPQVIARCADPADVRAAVRIGSQLDVDIAVRGGGHNGAGLGTCDGLVIDLSLDRVVRIDRAAGLAYVNGGARVADVDHAGHSFGLATPAGIIGSTGFGGLALGGGLGHLTRRYGLTIDNLESADVVLADGSVVTTDAGHEPELFWALRGGGGNFGVVTQFRMRMHPLSTVVAGPTLFPMERTEEVLRWYRDFLPNAPRELNGIFVFLTVPPEDPFPAELRMQKMCGIVWCYAGDQAGADRELAGVRALGPVLDAVLEMPYPAWNSSFDDLYPAGDQWYWRADFVQGLSDQAVGVHAAWGARLPSWKSGMHLYPVDGAAHDVGPDETAWAYRDATWSGVITGVDPDPASLPALRDWCVGYWEAQHPHSAGGAYANFLMDEGTDRVQATYGRHYERLATIKAAYDPGNVFHVNQNIGPASTIALPEPRSRVAGAHARG